MGKMETPPWTGMTELGTRDDLGAGLCGGVCAGCWTPVADLLERDDAFVLQVELPGMSLDNVIVELKGRDLWICGATPRGKDAVEPVCGPSVRGQETASRTVVRHHVVERARGPFARRFVLPCAVSRDDIRAVLRHGLLTVTLKKGGGARRSIPVE
jgi:HSP20 family protein